MKAIVQGYVFNSRGECASFTFDDKKHYVSAGAGTLSLELVRGLVTEMHAAAMDSDLFKEQVEGDKRNPSEIATKTRQLAEHLLHLATGQKWDDAEPETQGNYWLNARQTILANPHLLSLVERERLSSNYPELAV